MCLPPPPAAPLRKTSSVVDARNQLRKHRKSLQSFAAFCLGLGALAYARPTQFSRLANPLGLGPALYAVGWFVKCGALAAIDQLVLAFLEKRYGDRPMPYRENTGARGLAALEWIDHAFLAINSVIEFVFACHVADIVVSSPDFAWRPAELSFVNTLPALYLVFAVDDAFYAPTHLLMHRPWFYPYVHKHHHRQNLPERGYLDAGNEHPIEQVLGLSCLYATLVLVSRVVGLHAVTILVHFLLYAVLALLNHTAYDVEFAFWGFEYTVRAHETHHRYPTKNLAQYFMFWDKLYGTYKPYYDGADKRRDGVVAKGAKAS
mmetsp:Transcript_18491/g.56922  ORF Transcript_18491/g.56922 Transcript_18491/m.56922 type:complete len:318 (-) Transcript_18491:31-984(-)